MTCQTSCDPRSCGGGCGCCQGVAVVTPRSPYQRPGLPAIGYRSGTHADFLGSMRARIAAYPALAPLTARTTDDPAIALLDCWALVADIVTFYGERAANEGYLGTASDPRSIIRLGRLVNWHPRPALGSSGHLTFTMDPGSTGVIPAGTSANSVAGPGELPQTFETSETVDARADWNQLGVRLTRPFAISSVTLLDLTDLTFDGSSLNLKAGDLLILDFGSTAPGLREIATVTPDFQQNRTLVTLVPVAGHPVGLPAALAQIDETVKKAAAEATTAFQQETVDAIGDAAPESVGAAPQLSALATISRVVAESAALADAGRLTPAEASWVEFHLGRVGDAVRAATPLVADFVRGQSPELAYLERLAVAITCPDTGKGVGRMSQKGPDDCSRATPLLATSAALRALRRPPSRPPELASALSPTTASALDPSSSSLISLLASADPRLSGTLAQAIGTQQVNAPRLTSQVIALRSRANPVSNGSSSGDTQLDLDGSPDNLVPGGWLVTRQLDSPEDRQDPFVARIVSVQRYARSIDLGKGASPVAVPTSLVTADATVLASLGDVDLKEVTAWFGDQPLSLADEAIADPVRGDEIALDQTYPGLAPGRRLVITGERSDIPGVTGIVSSELTMIGAIEQRLDLSLPGDITRPVLVLATPLAYEYVRDTVVIRANVAAATQGETRSEVLGSGVACVGGQSFTLKQPTVDALLTWLPSVSAEGASNTLTVRVNGVRWHPTTSMPDAGPRDHSYAVEYGDAAAVAVRFGDGVHGSRLPNGIENITASYRVGAGRSGNVRADTVRQLTSRPLGVGAVSNALPMTGGSPGDEPVETRELVPLRMLALDRLVSVADYADFAAAHAGIAKASAARLFDGRRELVHLTIAAVDDVPLDPGDLLLTSLESTLAAYGDPHLPVSVASRDELWLVLSAGLRVNDDYLFDDVATRVRARLLEVAGFHRARLAEPVYLSTLVTAMQQTAGVDYVDVDGFGALPSLADPVRMLTAVLALEGVADAVAARPARFVDEDYVVGNDPTGLDDSLSTIALRHGLTLTELVGLNGRLRSTVLPDGQLLTLAKGLRPAQLACFNPEVPETLILRSIP